MRSLRLLGTCVLLALPLATVANACGEKFLVPGGAIDAQCVNAPSRTLSILIYGTDVSKATAALAGKDVVGMLKGVGHKVTVCKSAEECKDALTDGSYDMVLVDASSAKSMREQAAVPKGKHGTVVLPVIMTKSRAEIATAKHEFGRVVNADDDGLKILPVINRAASSSR
jgi:hypothetical protein